MTSAAFASPIAAAVAPDIATPLARAIASSPEATLEVMQGEASIRSLRAFFRYAWPHVVPDPLLWAWYCDALADHLAAVYSGQIRRLLINMPFRTAKSTFVSVLFPAWCWLKQPGLRFFTASHSAPFAIRDCWKTRKLINTPWYQQLILDEETGEPMWTLAGDQNEKGRYYNNLDGFRIATQVGAGTGEGGDINILDDPTTTDQAKSPVEREAANEWVFGTWWSRQNSPTSTRLIVMQQRQHPEDVSGQLLKKLGEIDLEVLHLPLEFRPELKRPPTRLGFEDPRTQRDEVIDEVRWTPPAVTELKAAIPFEDWEAQANQNPQASASTIVKPEWVMRWGPRNPLPARFDRMCLSVDAALKGQEKGKPVKDVRRSYVVIGVWGILGARAYLMDVRRGQWDFVTTEDEIRDTVRTWPAALEKWIEDEANGPAILSALGAEIPGLLPAQPVGSKYARFMATQTLWRARNVYVPEDDAAPWVRPYVAEITGYPNTTHDDQVDMTSQLLREVFHLDTFDFTFAGAPGGTARHPMIGGGLTPEKARAIVALHPTVLTIAREMMTLPTPMRADRFWSRWGLVGQAPQLDPPQAQALVVSSSSAADLAVGILALGFAVELDVIRRLLEAGEDGLRRGAESGPVATALRGLGVGIL